MTSHLQGALLAALAVLFAGAAAQAQSVRGMYFQVRSAPSAGSAGANDVAGRLPGGHAILGWRVKQGAYRGVRLDDLAVAAVIAADGPTDVGGHAAAQTTILVDDRADAAQQEALVQLAQDLAEESLGRIAAINPVKIDLRIAEGCACGHVAFEAGDVKVRTRSLLESDPAEFRASAKDKAALARVFYSYSAVTDEYACSLSDAQGRPVPVSGANLPTALVGGFSR